MSTAELGAAVNMTGYLRRLSPSIDALTRGMPTIAGSCYNVVTAQFTGNIVIVVAEVVTVRPARSCASVRCSFLRIVYLQQATRIAAKRSQCNRRVLVCILDFAIDSITRFGSTLHGNVETRGFQ